MSAYSSDSLRTPSPLLRSLPVFPLETGIVENTALNTPTTLETEGGTTEETPTEGTPIEVPAEPQATIGTGGLETEGDWSDDEVFAPEEPGDEQLDASTLRRLRFMQCYEFEHRKLVRAYRRTIIWGQQILDTEVELESYVTEVNEEYERHFRRLLALYCFELQMIEYDEISEAGASDSGTL